MLFLLFLVILFVVLVFTVTAKAIFILNTVSEEMNLTLSWFDPFLKIRIGMKDSKPLITVFLLHMRIFNKAAKQKKRKSKLSMLKTVKTTDITISADYGFRDKFITGLACGTVSFLTQLIPISFLFQNPDFWAEKDYIRIKATAKINIGITLTKIIKQMPIKLKIKEKQYA